MKNNKKLIVIIGILLLISGIVTFSYAYWSMTNEQTTMNKLTSGCLSITLEGEDSINLNNAFPITDEEGMELTPYHFTISNTCDLFVSYNVSLEILENSTLPIKYVRGMINKEAAINLSSLESATTSIDGSIDSKVLTGGSLGSGDSTDYSLRIWMDESVTIDDTDAINKQLLSKVTVTAVPSSYSPVANGFTNLAEALLVNEYQTTDVDVAKNKITSKQEVDTAKTAPVIDWKEKVLTTSKALSIYKADKSLIGSYGVTENYTKVVFGNSYSFNQETGYFTLKDYAYYNPEEVDFGAKDYYICSSGITTTAKGTLYMWNNTTCTSLYKINSYTATYSSTINLDGETLPLVRFVFDTTIYSPLEMESDKSDKGLYEALDDYGTTYYYRGNVTNNYVYFGGFYWRVVRINGDGSIRLLYAGTSKDASGSNLQIGTSGFAVLGTNATYVGYMYSNTLDTSYLDTISNDNDSAAKTKLDSWYKTNIVDTGYSSYIEDSGFCNDRSLSITNPGNGYDNTNHTYYAPYYRMQNHAPTFSCPNPSNDLFTLVGNDYGNAELTYPVGLITIDELAFAGFSSGYLNKMSYAYTGTNFWTMSPAIVNATNTYAHVYRLVSDGSMAQSTAATSYGIRPVINLKSSTEITGGIGTANDPFIVK